MRGSRSVRSILAWWNAPTVPMSSQYPSNKWAWTRWPAIVCGKSSWPKSVAVLDLSRSTRSERLKR